MCSSTRGPEPTVPGAQGGCWPEPKADGRPDGGGEKAFGCDGSEAWRTPVRGSDNRTKASPKSLPRGRRPCHLGHGRSHVPRERQKDSHEGQQSGGVAPQTPQSIRKAAGAPGWPQAWEEPGRLRGHPAEPRGTQSRPGQALGERRSTGSLVRLGRGQRAHSGPRRTEAASSPHRPRGVGHPAADVTRQDTSELPSRTTAPSPPAGGPTQTASTRMLGGRHAAPLCPQRVLALPTWVRPWPAACGPGGVRPGSPVVLTPTSPHPPAPAVCSRVPSLALQARQGPTAPAETSTSHLLPRQASDSDLNSTPKPIPVPRESLRSRSGWTHTSYGPWVPPHTLLVMPGPLNSKGRRPGSWPQTGPDFRLGQLPGKWCRRPT